MIFLNRKPLSRRTLLRGAGAALPLPLLEAMMPTKASAQTTPKRFFGFFMPNGTEVWRWHPEAENGAFTGVGTRGSVCLQDLGGFGAEGPWPACGSQYGEISTIVNLSHRHANVRVHGPQMALQAFAPIDPDAANVRPSAASLDVKIAERAENRAVFDYVSMSTETGTDNSQHTLSYAGPDTPAFIERDPSVLFNRLFSASQLGPEQARGKQMLDFMIDDVNRLKRRLGQADRERVDEFAQSVSELENRLLASSDVVCDSSDLSPTTSNNRHERAKNYIDIAVLAMSCDLTRVANLQYAGSWSLGYDGYTLGDGKPDITGRIGVNGISDHFVSHKTSGQDRDTSLDNLPGEVKAQLSSDRVVLTSRFKVRRFAYLVDKLRNTTTPTGNLLDETIAMFYSEIGQGHSHNHHRLPVLLAGRGGGFTPGQIINANNATTASLHCALLNRFGYELNSYGAEGEGPLSGV